MKKELFFKNVFMHVFSVFLETIGFFDKKNDPYTFSFYYTFILNENISRNTPSDRENTSLSTDTL